MKKKFLAVLLVLCAVVLFALPAYAASDTSVGYTVNVTLSADSYFCGTAGHTGEVTSISIKNVDHSKWDSDPARPLTVLFEVSFKCNTCGVSGSRIANNALNLTFRDANSCHAPFSNSVTAHKLLTGRDDSITFTLTRDKIGYAEKVEKKDATCTESGISQTCWECQGCKQIFSDENCTNKLANDISGVTIPASGHSLTHYEAQDANCQHDGWVEHWRCEKCNGYFLDAAGLNPTGSSSVMRYDRNKHVGETVYVPYNLEGKRNHKVYPSCHPGIFTTEPHVLGDSSKGEDPDCCALCGQIVAAKVLHSVDPYEKRFFAHDDAIADFNNSETSEEIHFLRSFDRTVSINKAGTVRLAEGKYITYMNVGDYDVTIWNDGEITILNAYSSTTLRGSNTSFYGTINNKTEGGTVGDLLFGYTSNWAYYVTEDSQWISRAAASTSSISRVRVMDSPFTYIEITGTGVKKATDEADKYTLTAIRGGTVTLKASTFSVPPTTPAESSMTWGCGGIPDKCVNTVLSAGGDPTLTLSDLPSGTYTLTFTRTAVNKFSVSATLVLTVEETRTAHTVTFDPNGGTLNEGDISSRSVFPGDAYGELPTPTRDSHRFDGWYTAPVGGTKVYETTVVTELEDHTLYAHWTYYHEHCVCGGTLNHTHENVEWQAWDGKSAIEYEQKWVQVGEYTKQGRYVAYVYLTGNVSANLTVAPKHILYLCLNGYSFTCADPSQPAITLTGEDSSKPAELDLCDCVGSGTLGGSNASGGSIRIGTYTNATLYGGTLTGNNVSGNGGAVSVTGGNCSFTMHGGTITGNSATTGGGIYATTGSVTINGGVISNNSAANGGGIYAASGAQFHLNGGEITGNTATNEGGGVYCSNLYSQNTGRCEFYGGTISGNTAQRGGGAYVRVCFIGYRNCRITGNTAAEAGGGLYLVPFASEKRIYMGNVYGSGGTIAPYIYDNTVNSAQNNLYLSDPDTQIQFTSHIDTNADIKLGVYFTGITSNGASVLLNYLQINSESRAKTYLDRIFCDNPEYGLLEIQQDGEYYNLYLRSTISAVKVTLDPNGGTLSAGEESKFVQPDSTYGPLPTPTRDSYRFDGWFTAIDGGTKVEETTIMSSREAHTLYAHWTFLHEHCICGGDTAVGDHTAHTSQVFTAWNGTDAISYTNNTAYVYLSQNVTISSNLVVDGTTLYLCLSGNTFASNGTNKIQVKNGGRLVLCDCAGGGTIKGATSGWGGSCVYLYKSTLDIFGGMITGGKVSGKGGGGAIALDDSKCVLNIYGGEISGNNGKNSGGAIFLNSTDKKGGTVNMYGGTIANNTATNGGVIYSACGGTINLAGGTISGNTADNGGVVYATSGGAVNLTLSGCTISGNKATNGDGGVINMAGGTVTISGAKLTGNTSSRYGGAVYLHNGVTATMTSGEISNNQAASEGGAVHVYGTSTFNLSGGKITGNSSVDGGAIYLNREPSVLNMSGGVISGNTATGNGGGVYIYRTGSICNLSGGTIENNTAGSGGGIYVNPNNSGQLKLSGAPVVRNNTVSGAANNVYLPSGKTLTIAAPMELGASIGVTTGNTSYPVAFSNAYDEDYSKYFSSDDAAAEAVYKTDKKLYLDTRQYGITISSTDGGTASADYSRAAAGTQITLTAKPNEGYHFKEWKVLSSDIDITENRFVMPAGDVTIQAVFEEHSFTAETAEEMYLKSAATCTEKAVYYKSCSVCGLSSKGTADEATFISGDILGHDYGAWTSNGTGTHTRVCSRDASHTETDNCTGGTADCKNRAICETCGGEYGDLASHNFTAEIAEADYLKSDATCTAKAVYYKSCTVCGLSSKGTTDEATFTSGNILGHDWGAWTSNGNDTHTRVCSRDASHTETDNCSGGTASCTKKAVCEDCGGEYGEMNAHDFTAETAAEQYLKYAATCTEKAVYYKSCTVCGLSSKGTANEATFTSGDILGHDWGAWTSNGNDTHTRTCKRDESHTETDNCSGGTATCTAKAVCAVCNGEYGETKAHDFTAEKADAKYLKSAATCTEKAVYYKSCTVCGLSSKGTADEATFESGNILGHDWGAWTSNGNGTHTRVCSRDASHTETDNCSGGTATCTAKAVCEVCKAEYGEKDPEHHAEGCELEWIATANEHEQKYSLCGKVTIAKEKHTFGDWTVTQRPTSNRDGEKERICQICQYKETKTIPATGSNYSYYTIKATAGTGGSISPSGSISVREGRDQTFTITPDKGYAVANVKIDGKSIGAVKSYTFENVRRTHTIEVIFMKANGNPQTGVFVDVATGSYYEDAVDWAVENGITKGTDDTHFSPDGICTRAQAVTFLWRAAGSPAAKSSAMPFTDVKADSYYYDAVLWAVENGITKGTSDTTFSPNMTCTRAQIVTFLWRSEKSPAAGTANPFADVKSTAYYADAVLWAVKENITRGTTNTTFSPDADCTRAQIVTFLWRCKK